MIYGYTRVSSKKQLDGYGLEVQKNQIIERYPDAIIYEEQYTGSRMDRPVFGKLNSKLKTNDILVVAKLDRLARNTVDGIQIIQDLFERKVSIHILNIGLLEDTPMGKFFLTTLLAVAELERNMILERTQSGRELARMKDNFQEGRPRKYSDEYMSTAIELLQTHSYREVVAMTGISKSTLARYKKNH